jgi:uncharacterized membrane protein
VHGGGACPLRPVKSFFFDRHGNVPRQRVRPPAHAFCYLQQGNIMSAWWFGYGAALVVIGVLDGVWLGLVARDFYRQEMGELMAPTVRALPAAVFYLAYPAGLVSLALQPLPPSASGALWRAALVGAVAYGTYDLTNLAVLRNASVKLALVDLAWGTLISAVAGTAAYFAMQRSSVSA